MPTETDPLVACEKEFNEARSALAVVQRANRDAPDAETKGKLTAAQDRFIKAGQELRRAQDPERALDIVEYQRYIGEKARIRASKAGKRVLGRD